MPAVEQSQNYESSQVSFIYIAQYHKSQFASGGFTICTAYDTDSVLRSSTGMRKNSPKKALMTN